MIIITCMPNSHKNNFAFGSGSFGRWIRDRFGLVAYEYTMDQYKDPNGKWDSKLNGQFNRMWHQIGNDRIVALAHNHGFVELFYNDTGPKYLNAFERRKNQHAGGFGFILEDENMACTLFPSRPEGCDFKRVFGMGYYEKELTHNNLRTNQLIFAPAGNLTALISRHEFENLADKPKKFSYIEYWDVNILDMLSYLPGFISKIFSRSVKFLPEYYQQSGLLVAASKKHWGQSGGYPPKARFVDPEHPSVFLAALDTQVSGYDTRQCTFFGADHNLCATPAILREMKVSPMQTHPLNQKDICLALKTEIALKPGEKKVINFAYGYAKDNDPVKLVIDRLQDPNRLFGETMEYWRSRMPGIKTDNEPYLDRELKWDYYYLNSSSLWDGYSQHCMVPQGGNYVYASGMHGATRDFGSYAQTLAYFNPKRAKEQLSFMMRYQDEGGRLFYDIVGYGKRYTTPYRPSDLDLWFLWAAVEYVFATRDWSFLDETHPFYPRECSAQATTYEHMRFSFRHLVDKVKRGPHGLIRLRWSDWNDETTMLVGGLNPFRLLMAFMRGESTLNTAMACLILPMFSELAEKYGDTGTASEARKYTEDMREALKTCWRGKWLNRAWSGTGKDYKPENMYLETQVWALLAGDVLDKEQTSILINEIREKLIKPSNLGMMISTSTSGSTTTKPGEQEEGGIWFAINGPAAVALSLHDQDLAWEELKKNTLAWHANEYPHIWYGIWSGPDAFNSKISERAGETWYFKSPVVKVGPQGFPVMNNHAHSQVMYAVARMAGLNPQADGYIMDPRIPLEEFSFNCAVAEITKSKNGISGRFTFENSGECVLRVRTVDSIQNSQVMIDDKPVEATVDNGFVKFALKHNAHNPVRWEISCAG